MSEKIKVDLRDPGMLPKVVEVADEAALAELLEREAEARCYTRVFVLRPGDKRKRGEKWVRAVGTTVWKKWQDMGSMEQHFWRLQDSGSRA